METVYDYEKRVFPHGANKADDVKIAIVEDDPMFRQAMEYYLNKVPGHRVFSFGSGEECFKHYHQLDPEILILDFKLSESAGSNKMNGLDIMEEVKAVKPETEIIFLTGQGNFDIATAAIKGGAVDYIIKDDKALNKMMDEVKRISFIVRLKRQESKNFKGILTLTGIVIVMMLIIYFSGFGWFSLPMKIFVIASCAGIATWYFIAMRNRKKMSEHFEHKADKPGAWVD
ncbi:MAG: response regulator [Bacteroidetes bacterium]|nr:response regulator [Bacteroidota bacterium]